MSHQDAKQIARDTVRQLLSTHPPGFVAMVLDQLKIIRRATKDLTVYADPTAGTQTTEQQTHEKSQSGQCCDQCPSCGAAINAASLLAKRPSPARAAAARRAATFPRPNRRRPADPRKLGGAATAVAGGLSGG